MGSARSISPVAWGSVEQAYIAFWQPEIRYCRSVTFQLAKVAVTQHMLPDILRLDTVIGAEKPIPEEIDHREIAVPMAVVDEMELLL